MEYFLVVYSTRFEYRVYSLLNPSVFCAFFEYPDQVGLLSDGCSHKKTDGLPYAFKPSTGIFRLPNASVEELDHLGLCSSGSPHGIPPSE